MCACLCVDPYFLKDFQSYHLCPGLVLEAAVLVQMWETEICYENLSTLYIAAPRAAKICILLF